MQALGYVNHYIGALSRNLERIAYNLDKARRTISAQRAGRVSASAKSADARAKNKTRQ